ncbi:MAG: hypothetical protein GX810_01195, partial [Clostridiales bacterium]|nr:hypothetical protein [Clostridiales bacterium]
MLLATGTVDKPTHDTLFGKDALPYQEVFIEEASMADAPSGAVTRPMPGTVFNFDMAPFNTNEYNYVRENRFLNVRTSPLSTFAADVDTASYAQVRAMILRGEPVPVDSVRVEEMLNYFKYDYAKPKDGEPFGVTMQMAKTPWNDDTLLLLIGLAAAEIPKAERPPQNLVFLIDVSGSMDMP